MYSIKDLHENGMLLRKFPKKEQTTELCKIAIEQNPLALKYASAKCLTAEICQDAMEKDVQVFAYLPKKYMTEKMCWLAIEKKPEFIEFVPDRLKTGDLCRFAIDKTPNLLWRFPEKKKYELFDQSTDFSLIEKVVKYDESNLMYMPNRPDVIKLCIQLMEERSYIIRDVPEKIKNSKEMLEYLQSKGYVCITRKYYDGQEKCFKILTHIRWYDYNAEVRLQTFEEFYKFLNGDLAKADLTNYDFKEEELKKYPIEGAAISSSVLQKYGLYDGSYFEELKRKYCKNEQLPLKEKNKREIPVRQEQVYLKPLEEENDVQQGDVLVFYISDIHLTHRIFRHFSEKATKEEIECYIRDIARQTVESVGKVPSDSLLLIGGDTSSCFSFVKIFFEELILLWDPYRIVVILGNHELWDPWTEMEKNIQIYSKFFNGIGVHFLQNDVLYLTDRFRLEVMPKNKLLEINEEDLQQQLYGSGLVILGGIGFTGLKKIYNASIIKYGKSFEEVTQEEAIARDIQATTEFNEIYKKMLRALSKTKVIVLTHTPKDSWNAEEYNPKWVYLHGHNHRNFKQTSDQLTVYADNQIGYKADAVGLKYFHFDMSCDIFAYYENGIYQISADQYRVFNAKKGMAINFSRQTSQIYMLKQDESYMFLIYCKYNDQARKEKLYLLNGGIFIGLSKNEESDVEYYFTHLKQYAKNVRNLMITYDEKQKRISDLIKKMGGSGRIHGCIIDVDKPQNVEDYSWCHLFFNPIDGKVTPYMAYDVKSRIVYEDLKHMIESECPEMMGGYLQIEENQHQALAIIQSRQDLILQEKGTRYDDTSPIYKISRFVTNLRYCVEKGVVRIWNEQILNNEKLSYVKIEKEHELLSDSKYVVLP